MHSRRAREMHHWRQRVCCDTPRGHVIPGPECVRAWRSKGCITGASVQEVEPERSRGCYFMHSRRARAGARADAGGTDGRQAARLLHMPAVCDCCPHAGGHATLFCHICLLDATAGCTAALLTGMTGIPVIPVRRYDWYATNTVHGGPPDWYALEGVYHQ